MNKCLTLLSCLALVALGLTAAETKEVTLEGTGMCGKCELARTDGCTNALQVEQPDGEVVTYLFTNNLRHGEFFCIGRTEGLVVQGTLVEEDGETKITATSVEKKES